MDHKPLMVCVNIDWPSLSDSARQVALKYIKTYDIQNITFNLVGLWFKIESFHA